MKFIFLTTLYDDTTGGTKYDRMFMERVKDNGNEVKTICDKDFVTKGDRHYYNKQYKHMIPMLADADYFVTNSRLYTRLEGVIKLIRKENPAIKIIAFHHHFNFMTQKGIKRVVHKYFELSFLNSLDKIIFASGYVFNLAKKYIKDNGYLIETVIPKPKLTISNKTGNKLLYIGSLENRKGTSYLIKAFYSVCQQEQDSELIIVGKGTEEYTNHILTSIFNYGIQNRVKLMGRVNEADKIKLLNECDIFVFPSLLEGLGLAIREAMSYGLPVIAFDNSAMGYTIKNNFNGILVKNKDVVALSEAILSLLKDSKRLRGLSDGAITSANTFGSIGVFYNNIDSFLYGLGENDDNF